MRTIAGLLSALCFFSAWSSEAWAEPPAVKLLSAPGVSPSSAWAYYGGSTTHTTGAGAWTSGRPPELVALARTLGSDQLAAGKISASTYAQNVFDYARNNIDTEFRFGLAKGARGAVIDQSGTPFDQAHLMVELLRQGGVAANYQVGTITLSAADFGKWTGLVHNLNETAQTFDVNAQAACQFLADGGIPVVVGSSSDCSSLSGNLSSITLGHIWVAANGSLYDPAYKRHSLRTGIDVASAMGCGTNCGTAATSSALSGATQGTLGGAPTLQNINDPALYAQLQTWAINLENSIENTRPDAAVEEIVGGRRFDPTSQATSAAPLEASSPNFAWTGDIPDQFRSKIRLDIGSNQFGFFADEIEGQRLKLAMGAHIPTATSYSDSYLVLEEQVLGSWPGSQMSSMSRTLTVHAPYRFASGTAETTYSLLSDAIQIFWGNVGAGRLTFFSNLVRAKPLLPYGFVLTYLPPCPEPPAQQSECDPGGTPPTISDQSPVAAEQAWLQGVSWYNEVGQAIRVIEGLSKSRTTLHFTYGGGMSFASALSVTASNGAQGNSSFETIAAVGGMLEGASLQESSRSWRAGSSVANITWYEKHGGTLINATAATWQSVIPYLSSYGQEISFPQEYINLGATLILPRDKNPIQISAEPSCPTCNPIGTIQKQTSGYLAYSPGAISYIAGYNRKGAGDIGSIPDPLGLAMKSAERQTQTARTNSATASLATGDLQLAAAPDLVTGAGAFPHSLPFVRIYNSGHGTGLALGNWLYATPWFSSAAGPDKEAHARLGGGWSHNYQISARLSNDISTGLGDYRGVDAVEAISAILVVLQAHATPTFESRVTGMFTMNWLGERFVDNAATISFPGGVRKFVRRPDASTFRSPLSSSETLMQSGTKSGLFRLSTSETSQVAYGYAGVTLSYSGADGAKIDFANGKHQHIVLVLNGAEYDLPEAEFVPTKWTFPDGAEVHFDYVEYRQYQYGSFFAQTTAPPPGTYAAYQALKKVRNWLGRSLEFEFGGPSLPESAIDAFRIDNVRDETGRTVRFERTCPNTTTFEHFLVYHPIVFDCATFEVIAPDNTRTIYNYTPVGHVSSLELPPEEWTPLFDSIRPSYKLRRVFTPSSHTVPFQTIVYDELGRAKSITNVAGENTDYLPGAVSVERWKRGQSIDPLGNVSTTIFDEDSSVIQSINPLGFAVRNTYDDAGRLMRTVQPAGNAEERTYDVRSNILTTCLIPKERWDQACSAGAGDIVTTVTYVEGPTVGTCANPKTCNQPASAIDALGNVSNYSWNANGDLEQILLPADSGGQRPQTNYGYTTHSAGGANFRLLTSITEKKSASENILSTFAYDVSNKYVLQSGTVDPGGLNLTTTLAFDAIGNLTSVDGPRTDVGDIATYQWDALRRPVVVAAADPDGGGPLVAPRSIVKFDADGLVNFTASLKDNGEWRGVVTQHDVVGRPRKVTRPKTLSLGAISTPAQVAALPLQTVAANDNYVETTYDAAGRTDIVADPENRQTKTVYDAASQVQKVIRAFGTSLQQDYQTNTYTPNGRLQSVASAKGFITRFSYDGFDRSTRTSWPDCASATDTSCAFSEILSYDKAGNVLSSRNRAGQAFSFTYDGLNRLTRKAAPDRVETYAYDLLGLQTCGQTWLGGNSAAACDPGAGSPETRTSQVWDKAKRLVSETQVAAGQTLTVGYQYADKVNRTGIVWPDGWRAVYSFDALNRLASVAADTDSNGSAETSLALYRYDALSQLAGVRRGVPAWGAGVSDTDLVWEADGDVDSVKHAFNGEAASWIYDYDKSAKLILESKSVNFLYKPSVAQAISYSTGDPTSKTNKLDQYALVNAQAVTWDLNGNRASSNGLTTTHDSENRLVHASQGSMTVVYLYDTGGRRMLKNFTSGPAEFVDTLFLNASDMEIAEYCIPGQANCSGNGLLRRYVPGLKVDDRVAMIESTGAVSYYHPDRLGNVVAMTNASGQVADRYKYTPFGIECGPNPTCTGPGSSGNVFRYTGRRFDPETGLYHYRARYYDPSEAGGGRFLETDPVGYADQMNLYAYVANDPLNATDPTGMQQAYNDPWLIDELEWKADFYASLTPEQRLGYARVEAVSGGIATGAIVGGVACLAYCGPASVALAIRYPWLVPAGTVAAKSLGDPGHDPVPDIPIGRIAASGNHLPGSGNFGQEMHAGLEGLLRKMFPNSRFKMETLPGQTGVDATWRDIPGSINPGFDVLELSRGSPSGFNKATRQLEDWFGANKPRIAMWFYDDIGDIYDDIDKIPPGSVR